MRESSGSLETPAPTIRAVGFDATGTLFRPRDLGADHARILRRHGIDIPADVLARLIPQVWNEFGCNADPARDRFVAHPRGAAGFWRDLLDRVCALAGQPRPSAFAAAELFEHYATAAPWQLDDDSLPVLTRLRAAGLRLVIISNWDPRLPRVLRALELADHFEAVLCSALVGVEKPHPGIFAAAASALDLPAEACVHVGDRRLEDREGAEGAGWHGLLLDRAGGGDLAALSELPARLEQLERGSRLARLA